MTPALPLSLIALVNRIPLFLLGALALALPLHAQVPADVPEGEVHIYKTSAGEPQEMQVYLPPNHDPMTSAKVPGILFFHGGGWTGGNLTQFQRASYYFASRGLVCATANYRMLSREEVKAQEVKDAHKAVCVTDAKSAIRWFKSQADTFGLDPDRIVVGGGSAGGHVAVLSTLNPDLNDPKDPDDEDVTVVAYLLFNPAFATGPVSPEVDPLLHLKNGLAPAIVFFGTEDTRWLAGWDLARLRDHFRLQKGPPSPAR